MFSQNDVVISLNDLDLIFSAASMINRANLLQ